MKTWTLIGCHKSDDKVFREPDKLVQHLAEAECVKVIDVESVRDLLRKIVGVRAPVDLMGANGRANAAECLLWKEDAVRELIQNFINSLPVG